MHPSHKTIARGNRRTFLKRLLGIGVGTTTAGYIRSASAARRGQPSNLSGFGYAISVLDGPLPGDFKTVLYRAAVGRAIVFSNFTSVDFEVEVIQPDSEPSTVLLGSSWSLRVPIDHPGSVRWRVWRSGQTPGEFHILDFPG